MPTKKVSIRGRVIMGVNTFICITILFLHRIGIGVVIPQIVTINDDHPEKIRWIPIQKSYTLMSFYAGFIFTQLLSGILGEKYGPKLLLGVAVVVSSIMCLLSPVALERSPIVLAVVRALMGAAHGPFFPCTSLIVTNWYSPGFRSTAVGLIFPGIYMGTILSFSIISGLAVNNELWRVSFYLFGLLGFVWLIFWIIFTTDVPVDNKWITEEEKNHLMLKVERLQMPDTKKFPVKAAVKSLPLWGIISFHFQSFWSLTFILTIIPSLVQDLYRIEVKDQAYLTFLIPIVMWIGGLISCTFSDFLLRKNRLAKVNIRRLFGTLSTHLTGLFLMFSTFISPEKFYWGIILMLIACFCCGIQLTVLIPNINDIAPQYSGIIAGISNTIATTAAILSIETTYIIVSDTHKTSEWRIVFGLMLAVQFVAHFLFVVFVGADVQEWALTGKTPE